VFVDTLLIRSPPLTIPTRARCKPHGQRSYICPLARFLCTDNVSRKSLRSINLKRLLSLSSLTRFWGVLPSRRQAMSGSPKSTNDAGESFPNDANGGVVWLDSGRDGRDTHITRRVSHRLLYEADTLDVEILDSGKGKRFPKRRSLFIFENATYHGFTDKSEGSPCHAPDPRSSVQISVYPRTARSLQLEMRVVLKYVSWCIHAKTNQTMNNGATIS